MHRAIFRGGEDDVGGGGVGSHTVHHVIMGEHTQGAATRVEAGAGQWVEAGAGQRVEAGVGQQVNKYITPSKNHTKQPL